MTELAATLSMMRRPPLLVRAARFGAAVMAGRSRKSDGSHQPSLNRLLEEEEALNMARITGEAGYSPTRHVEILTALVSAATPTPHLAAAPT